MLLDKTINIPDLGLIGPESGFHLLETTEDGKFITGKNGVENIVATGDKKVEFVSFGSHTLAGVKSAIAYPVYYPVYPVKTEYPLNAVLMDLDAFRGSECTFLASACHDFFHFSVSMLKIEITCLLKRFAGAVFVDAVLKML